MALHRFGRFHRAESHSLLQSIASTQRGVRDRHVQDTSKPCGLETSRSVSWHLQAPEIDASVTPTPLGQTPFLHAEYVVERHEHAGRLAGSAMLGVSHIAATGPSSE